MYRRDFVKTAAVGAAMAAAPGGLLFASSDKGAAEARARDVLSRMSLREKVFQMSGHVWHDALLALAKKGHGYTGYTPPNKRLGIPALTCLDGPRGVGFLYRTTCFPVSAARGASWDPDLEERIGRVMGYEAAALGANMLLTPCINLVRHPSFGRAQECYGEDPFHTGVMGAAHVRGLQRHVIACPKHYACNNIDESRMFVNAVVDERTLREIYLPHFRMCVDAGAASVMSSYNDVNGHLSAHNRRLLRDILKGEWGFKGFVISDWEQAVEDTVAAANAGLDVEMPRPEHYGRRLVKAVEDGRVQMEVINEAVTRILRQKFAFETNPADYDRNRIASEDHASVALEAARKGTVLLKNRGGALPLGKEVRKIAVLGRLATEKNLGDRGSSMVTPPWAVTPLEGIEERAAKGVEVVYDSGSSPARAGKTASAADAAVVVAGLTNKDEGEGNDREDLDLHPEDIELIKAAASENRRTVVVLMGGAALTMGGCKDLPAAIIMAFYPGMEGGRAIADILFGRVNPSGKLSSVFPRSKDQLFEFDNKAREVKYGYHHGYRWFDKKGIEPEFPFGFGLSYTSYTYKNLRLDKDSVGPDASVRVMVDVTNKGRVAGEEIVQVYAGCRGSKVDRAKKDLKGFTRLALEPGQTKTAEVEIKARGLAYYDVEQGEWKVEPVEYRLYAGPSSKDSGLLKTSLRVKG